MSDPRHVQSDPGQVDAVADALDQLDRQDARGRLHDRDASLFSPDPRVQGSVAERLGWLDVTAPPPGALERLGAFTTGVQGSHDRVVLAGMGGSSLAPEVFAKTFGHTAPGLRLEVLDSTHPRAVQAAFTTAGLAGTLVVVASKSGTTEETRAFAALAASLVGDANQLVAITDPGSELEAQAFSGRWRDVFTNPADIGGRFSALSFFGMLPAALSGIDVERVWATSSAMARRCWAAESSAEDPAAVLGAFMAGHARAGRDKLTILTAPGIAALGDWIEQLVAESTGKDGTGVIPVVGEPVGPADVYGSDRAFVEIRLGGEPVDGTGVLAAAGHPVLTLTLGGPDDLGGAFLQWELATAYAGALLGVNPFDEPNVTESKQNTSAVLDEVVAGKPLPQPGGGDVRALLDAVTGGDYVSFQAYLPMTAEAQAALERARVVVRDRLRVATTVGFGPRFLHSTGQLHKGGPDSVAALQIVDTPEGGPPIPGRPYDFATLIRAQAAGDRTSLTAHGRRVEQVAVDDLDALVQLVDTATR